MSAALVVKVGGGLLAARGAAGVDAALAEVACLAADGHPVLVVPGGGPFADAVRAVDRSVGLSDALAHRLALRAMDQFGELLAERLVSLTAGVVLSAALAPGAARLACHDSFAGRPGIPEAWSVTSDSLAVYAAAAVGASSAVLLKPVPGVRAADGTLIAALTVAELAALAPPEVDAHLADAIRATGVAVTVRAPGAGAGAGTRIVPD